MRSASNLLSFCMVPTSRFF